MDFIKNWALGLVISGIIGTIVLVISPSGGTQKQVRAAVSLMLLVAFLHPFVSQVNFDFWNELTALHIVDDYDVRKSIEKQMGDNIKSQVLAVLTKNNIEVTNIITDIELDSENEMKIKKVTVFVTDDRDESKIKKLIRDELNISVDTEVK